MQIILIFILVRLYGKIHVCRFIGCDYWVGFKVGNIRAIWNLEVDELAGLPSLIEPCQWVECARPSANPTFIIM